jgi:hypothetical protein
MLAKLKETQVESLEHSKFLIILCIIISCSKNYFSKKHPINYLRFEKQFFAFSNRNILKTQFPNDLFSAIRFKITFFIYEIAIPNTP